MLTLIATLFWLCAAASAHMQLNDPPTFNASNNPHTTGPPDQFLFYPYNCCGRTTPFPCRGYLSLLGTPEGAPVATWAAGSKQHFSLTGIGNHYGGSCQVGFSVDKGKSFKVATSFEGDCPHRNGGVDPAKQTFDFTVPSEMPSGEAIFAWTWMNREQEFFMNCAAVTITKKSSKPVKAPSAPSNAAPSYDMDECSCTCASPFAMDKDNQYATGGCSCQCDKMPSPAKPGSIHKRAATTYTMGHSGCSCGCAEGAKKLANGPYCMGDCTCTCNDLPNTVSKRSSGMSYPHSSHPRLHRLFARDSAARALEVPEVEERSTTAFHKRPSMFFGNLVHDGCNSPHTTSELKYPKPGPNVVSGDGAYPLALPGPAENCGF